MNTKQYQAKVAAMPRTRINPVVLAFAVVISLLAIMAATLGAQAQETAQTGVLNWRVEWGVEETPGSWWTRWYADSTPDRQVYTGGSFPYQASGSGITKTLTAAGTSSLYKADSNHIWTAGSFWLAEGLGKDAYAGTGKQLSCLPGPKFEMNRDFTNRRTNVKFTNTLGKTTAVAVNNNTQTYYQTVAAGEDFTFVMGQIGEVRVYTDETRNEVCGYMWFNFDRIDQTQPVTLSIPDTTTVVGNEIVVPVNFSNNTGQIYSIDARLQYSPTHLTFVGIDQQGTATQNYQYRLNTQTPGSIIITGQGQQPITDESGLMLRLKFRAQRAGIVPVSLAGVQVAEVLINGGAIPVNGEYGNVTVNASLWTGAVYFWNGNKPMKDVVVTLTNGTDVITGITGWDGGYTIPVPSLGTWTATFNRETTTSDRNAVSALDAALTHSRAALLTTFGIPYMEWSADADEKQPITAYDANRILRYVARYNDPDTVCGEWRAEKITAEVNGPNSGGHISKLWLMCDVTGNWVPDGTVRAAELAETPVITTTVVSIDPLVLRVSSDQPFLGLALQFDQNVQAVTAAGFDTVEPNNGFVPLASMTDPVNSVDLTIVPSEDTDLLSLDSITVDEYDAVIGPTMSLEPQYPLPCVTAPDSCADMQVSLQVEPTEVEPGDMITVTAVVTNAGPANVTASLSVEVPSYVAVNDLKELASGQSYTWQQTYQAILGGEVKAMVASDATELRPGDEESTVYLTVMPAILEPLFYYLPLIQR